MNVKFKLCRSPACEDQLLHFTVSRASAEDVPEFVEMSLVSANQVGTRSNHDVVIIVQNRPSSPIKRAIGQCMAVNYCKLMMHYSSVRMRRKSNLQTSLTEFSHFASSVLIFSPIHNDSNFDIAVLRNKFVICRCVLNS